MKQFSLEEFKKNPTRNIVTRDGRAKVRIICTDAKREYPIIALLTAYDGSEVIYEYTKDGLITSCGECNLDLFFANEMKEGWLNIYPEDDICDTKEEALRCRANVPNARTIKIFWEE